MKNRFLLILGFALLFVTGCEEDPSSIGSTLFNKEFEIIEVSSDSLAQSGSYFKVDTILYVSSRRMLLGDAGDVESSIVMKYFVSYPDSLQDKLENDQITFTGAKARFTKNYLYGDSNAVLGFSVHELKNNWTTTGFNKDSLSFLEYDQSIDIAFNKTETDSTLEFNLDVDVVNSWIDKVAFDGVKDNNGIILKPQGVSKIVGFPTINSSGVVSNIELYYTDNSGRSDTLFLGQFIDVHDVEGTLPSDANNNYYLQSGLPVYMSYHFDLSFLPANAVLNTAELQINMDSLNTTFGSVASDTLYLYMLEDSTSNTIQETYRGAILTRTGNTYSGDIVSFIHNWNQNIENQGFRIELSDQSRTVNKVAIYNSNHALRPKILFTYTRN
ncbi:MAG: hypothetical protein K9G44_05195 [Melioribacteraceae bacterium]|nr:hypothetical protein [Melioribacteraceae bacterium]